MRIFVFSDTHGDASGMDMVVSKAPPDMIIHCGDGMDDALLIKRKYPKIELHAVPGNSDRNQTAEREGYLQIMGHTVYIAHGDMFNHGKGATRSGPESEIAGHARRNGADIALYGHTHVATFSYEKGIYIMNPGIASLKKPYRHKPRFGCIELYENNAIFKILSVEVFELTIPESAEFGL